MTLFSAVQGLLVFDLLPEFTVGSSLTFVLGVLLCLLSLMLVVYVRRRAGRERVGAAVDVSALLDIRAEQDAVLAEVLS